MRNVTCHVKAVRGKLGVLQTQYTFVSADDVVFELKWLYRNSKGRYLPFVIDVTLPLCDLKADATLFSKLLNKLVFESLKSHSPDLTKCPMNVSRKFLKLQIFCL